MQPRVQVFGIPKLGNRAEEYEDATASTSEGRRFAIADGATQTSFADRWSQILTLEYILNPPAESPTPLERWGPWLEPLQEAWSAGINWDDLPWFAVEKAREGACTTLLTVEFFDPSDAPVSPPAPPPFWKRLFQTAGRPELLWRAEAVGDSCLFHVRGDRLLLSFPVKKSVDLNHSPPLITTNPRHNEPALGRLLSTRGTCEHGDVFLMMTDALAGWFLREVESGIKPWRVLLALNSEAMFRQFVIEQRDTGRLENDDTTLMTVEWPRAGEAEE